MLRDSLLSMLSTGLRLLTSLVLFLVLAHAWGPAQFGVFMYPYAIAAILVKVVDYGFTLQIARDVGRDPDRSREIVGRALGAKLVLLVPTAIVAAVIALRMPTTAPYATLLALLLADAVVCSFALFLNVPLRAVGRFDREAGVTIGANLLFFAATAAALLGGAGPVVVATAFLLARLGFLAAAWHGFVATAGGPPHVTVDRASLGGSLGRGFPFAVHTVVATLSLQSDTVMIQHFMGASAVGLYQAGMRLLFGALLVGDALHNVFFASLARLGSDARGLVALATRMTRQFVALGVLLFAVLLAVGTPLVRATFAPQYAPLADLIPLFALSALARYAGLSYGAVLTLAERQGVRVLAASGVLAFVLALDVVLIPAYALRGALVASIAGEVVLHAVCAVAAYSDHRSALIDRRAAALLVATALSLPVVLSPSTDAGVRAAIALVLAGGAVAVGVTGEERRSLAAAGLALLRPPRPRAS